MKKVPWVTIHDGKMVQDIVDKRTMRNKKNGFKAMFFASGKEVKGRPVLWPLGHPLNGTQKCTNFTKVFLLKIDHFDYFSSRRLWTVQLRPSLMKLWTPQFQRRKIWRRELHPISNIHVTKQREALNILKASWAINSKTISGANSTGSKDLTPCGCHLKRDKIIEIW